MTSGELGRNDTKNKGNLFYIPKRCLTNRENSEIGSTWRLGSPTTGCV